MSMSNFDDEDTNNLDKTSVMTSDTFKVRIAQAGKAPPCLVLLVGPANEVGRQWPIEDTDRIIGRSINAHVSIEDKSVSKSHAKILMMGGDVSIIDLESTNKTIINSKTLKPLVSHTLKNNDQIKMGNIIFKFLEQGNIETFSVAQTFDRTLLDPLTKINNKGALMAQGPDCFKKASILGVPFSIIAFDIDFFTKVNSDHGHPGGDYVLQELTKVIKEKLIRENDYFARSGGEEFTLLLLGGDLEQAQDVGERLRKTIEEHEFSFEGVRVPITISVGLSTKKDSDKNWNDINSRADQALYKSKNNGRNKVTVLE